MGKKGNLTIYGLMLAVTIIILAIALAPAVSQSSELARNESTADTIGMNCNNETISDFTRAACYAVDLNPFYYIMGLILIAGGVITARIVFA